jgi:hypothetical protein
MVGSPRTKELKWRTKMTTEEKKARVEELEKILFHIDMIDRWDALDIQMYNKYSDELRELKKEIEADGMD